MSYDLTIPVLTLFLLYRMGFFSSGHEATRTNLTFKGLIAKIKILYKECKTKCDDSSKKKAEEASAQQEEASAQQEASDKFNDSQTKDQETVAEEETDKSSKKHDNNKS